MVTVCTIAIGILLIVLGKKFQSIALSIVGWCVLGYVLLIAIAVTSAVGAMYGAAIGG